MSIWKTGSPNRAVAFWVLGGTIMLLIQVMLGGITRLTGSGLSITEWNVITGTIPPLSHQQWMIEFDKYKQTPQYHLLNTGFSLSDFKFIFFWEWFHRFWARLVGVVFIVGFVYLLLKRKMKTEMIKPLLILFLLGALQGSHRLDHGSQRIDRRCAVCKTYTARPSFCFCPRCSSPMLSGSPFT